MPRKNIEANLQKSLALIGDSVELARVKKGYTQSDLALLVNMTRGNIANIEGARIVVTLPVLAQLATLLDLSFVELVAPFEAYPLTPEQITRREALHNVMRDRALGRASNAQLRAKLNESVAENERLRFELAQAQLREAT